jgi:hypothetical protein
VGDEGPAVGDALTRGGSRAHLLLPQDVAIARVLGSKKPETVGRVHDTIRIENPAECWTRDGNPPQDITVRSVSGVHHPTNDAAGR